MNTLFFINPFLKINYMKLIILKIIKFIILFLILNIDLIYYPKF